MNEPRRVLHAIGIATMAGGAFNVLGLLVPHSSVRYDPHFVAVGALLVLTGVACLWWSSARGEAVAAWNVHVATVVTSVAVLALSWLGMIDVGGIQAIFLVIPLAVSAAYGPLWWTLLLFLGQSLGYGAVLLTAELPLGFDAPSQWLVVTLGLAVALIYNDYLRRQMNAARVRDERVRAEREEQRAAHAQRLEEVNAQLAAANALKDRFVAMASHELRTPLTAISGFASTMTQRWDAFDEGARRHFVRIIEEQSGRLSRLVTDLLTLARIEDGRVLVERSPTQLLELVQRTIEMIDLGDVAVDCSSELQVHASPDHVEQILVNLLDNANAYGEPPICVSAEARADGVVIRVADHGNGVPSSFVPELFDRFARGPNVEGTERHSGGSGLGLSIVEGLARAYDGAAWYEPNEPHGARFCVLLPGE